MERRHFLLATTALGIAATASEAAEDTKEVHEYKFYTTKPIRKGDVISQAIRVDRGWNKVEIPNEWRKDVLIWVTDVDFQIGDDARSTQIGPPGYPDGIKLGGHNNTLIWLTQTSEATAQRYWHWEADFLTTCADGNGKGTYTVNMKETR